MDAGTHNQQFFDLRSIWKTIFLQLFHNRSVTHYQIRHWQDNILHTCTRVYTLEVLECVHHTFATCMLHMGTSDKCHESVQNFELKKNKMETADRAIFRNYVMFCVCGPQSRTAKLRRLLVRKKLSLGSRSRENENTRDEK